MITGKKVELRAVSTDDLKQLLKWRNSPGLRQYFREYRILSLSQEVEWYKQIQEDRNQAAFSICVNEHLIGCCGLHYIKWTNRTGEFGIYIGDERYRGGGYGKDALIILMRYGFYELNLNRIWGEVYSNNDALNVYYHIGLKKEGVLRDHYYCDGKYYDSVMVGILRDEFDELYRDYMGNASRL